MERAAALSPSLCAFEVQDSVKQVHVVILTSDTEIELNCACVMVVTSLLLRHMFSAQCSSFIQKVHPIYL